MKFRTVMDPFPCIIIILVAATFNVVQEISAEILEEVFQFNLRDKAKKSLYSMTVQEQIISANSRSSLLLRNSTSTIEPNKTFTIQ